MNDAAAAPTSEPIKKPRFSAPERRGFGHVIHELTRDFAFFELLNPKAPWLKRMPWHERRDAKRALAFMQYHAEAQRIRSDTRPGRKGVGR